MAAGERQDLFRKEIARHVSHAKLNARLRKLSWFIFSFNVISETVSDLSYPFIALHFLGLKGNLTVEFGLDEVMLFMECFITFLHRDGTHQCEGFG